MVDLLNDIGVIGCVFNVGFYVIIGRKLILYELKNEV